MKKKREMKTKGQKTKTSKITTKFNVLSIFRSFHIEHSIWSWEGEPDNSWEGGYTVWFNCSNGWGNNASDAKKTFHSFNSVSESCRGCAIDMQHSPFFSFSFSSSFSFSFSSFPGVEKEAITFLLISFKINSFLSVSTLARQNWI